jgi:Protein of unknown function (DUF5131)
MSDRSPIEWTDATWNPERGCTKISPGCKNCYAERFAERFRGVAGHPFEQGFDLRLVPHALRLPSTWKIGTARRSPCWHPSIYSLSMGFTGSSSEARAAPGADRWTPSGSGGGTQKKRAGRLLDGREWNELPACVQGENQANGRGWSEALELS